MNCRNFFQNFLFVAKLRPKCISLNLENRFFLFYDGDTTADTHNNQRKELETDAVNLCKRIDILDISVFLVLEFISTLSFQFTNGISFIFGKCYTISQSFIAYLKTIEILSSTFNFSVKTI